MTAIARIGCLDTKHVSRYSLCCMLMNYAVFVMSWDSVVVYTGMARMLLRNSTTRGKGRSKGACEWVGTYGTP